MLYYKMQMFVEVPTCMNCIRVYCSARCFLLFYHIMYFIYHSDIFDCYAVTFGDSMVPL